MSHIVRFLSCLLVLSILPPVLAEPLSEEERAAVDKALLAEMERQELVGLAVGVVRGGEIAYLEGLGHADREQKTPVTDKTVFNWASISKPFLAVAAMQLVEEGKLDLDADIRTYVPEIPDKGAKVTMRHLLCHQSGFPHYSNGLIVPLSLRRMNPASEVDPTVSLNRFGGAPLIFEPGERYQYSSYAYVVASAIVQRAGEQPLPEQLEERICRPLGLRSFQLDMPSEGQEHWTVGYKRGRSGEVDAVGEYAHYWKHGAGGYKSDIADIARWAKALINDELVGEEGEREMWTAQPLKDGSATNYGLGFGVRGSGDDQVISHNGSHSETRTRMELHPAKRYAVVVLCNTGHADTGRLTRAVNEALGE